MTQIATVEHIIDSNYAIISVSRKSACGHDCEECAGCGVFGTRTKAKAANPIGANPGQKVVVQSSTQAMLTVVFLVYAMPFLLFFSAYLMAMFVGGGVALQYTLAIIGFFLGILLAVRYDHRIKVQGGLSFTIVRVL